MPVHFVGVPPGGEEQRTEKGEIPIHAPAEGVPIFVAPQVIAEVTAQNERHPEEGGGQLRLDAPGTLDTLCGQNQKPQYEERGEKALNYTDIVESFGFRVHERSPLVRMISMV